MNQSLLNATVRNQVYLESLKTEQVGRFTRFLKVIDKDLKKRLTSEDLTEYSRTRFERLLSSIGQNLDQTFSKFRDEFETDLTEIGIYESEFEARSLVNTIDTAGFESVIPSARQVKSAIYSQPLSVRGADGGKLLKPFIKDWSVSDKKRIIGSIRQGFFEGKTNFQIIKDIRGTKAANYSNGVLAVVNRHADAIVRTSIQHVASVSRFETWKQNSNVVKGYRWVSALDSRTTDVCQALDGQVFTVGNGPKPPAHIRCRSTTIAELDSKYDYLKEGRTRAAKGGPVDGNKDYYHWLKDQSIEFQDDVLGPVRGRLFRDGGLSIQRFKELQLDKKFRPITLAEMRKKEPTAFDKAFSKPGKSKATSTGFQPSPAGKWHEKSFVKSRPLANKIAKNNQDVSVVKERGSAYAQAGQKINMAQYDRSTKQGQEIWRHEFGHIIDVRIGRKNKTNYVSSGRKFLTASNKDSENLKMLSGRGKRSKESLKAEATKQVAYTHIENSVGGIGVEKRIKFNRDLALNAGLDYDKLKDLMNETTGIGNDGSLTQTFRMAHIIEAIRLQDVETFFNYITFKYTNDFTKYKQTLDVDGVYGSISDLIGSCTRNVVCSQNRSYPGHTDSYYNRHPTSAPTESFANLMATYGHPNYYVFEIVQRFAPNITKAFLEIISDY